MKQRDGYLDLLRQNPNFRKLWLGQVVSLMGDWLSYVAVLGLVLELTNSGLAVALTMLARAIPYTLSGMAAGVVLDRVDRKKVLIVADLCRAVLAVAYLSVRSASSIWLVYLLGGAMQSFSAFFNPGLNAVIPSVCKEEERVTANSLLQSTHGITMVIGSAVGGLLVAMLGRDWAFILNGLSFIASTLFIMGVAIQSKDGKQKLPTPMAQFREGVRFIGSHATVLAIILRRMGERLGAGFNILLSVYAVEVWLEGEKGIGALYAILGFGLIIGSWVAKRLGKDATVNRMRWTIGWGNIAEAVFWIAFALSPNLWVGAVMMIFMVGGDIITNVTEVTLLQKLVPSELLGRVFAVRETLLTLAWAVALTITGIVSSEIGPKATALGIGGIMLLTAFAWMAAVVTGILSRPVPASVEQGGTAT